MRIRSFRALRPPVALAARVASPPYDVVDTKEARRLAHGNDASFLRIIRPEIDLPPGVNLYDDLVYRQAVDNLRAFIEAGFLCTDADPGLFLYRLIMNGRSQTGLVTTCHAEEYEQNVILKHERTMPAKENDRARHMDSLNAQTGPVFLIYKGQVPIDELVDKEMESGSLYDFTDDQDVRHTVWRVQDAQKFVDAFSAVPVAYVADGHHRSASAARVAKARREANADHQGDEAYNWFLSVLFPGDQLNVLAYNRVIKDLNGRSTSEFLQELGALFGLQEDATPIPAVRHRISFYVDGVWRSIQWESVDESDPVDALDVSVLQNRILAPLLDIDDPRSSDRIRFVGGIHGSKRLEEIVDAGEGAIAFSLFPTSVDALMRIADAGQIMPPKSTWFEPKLKSGLFLHEFGECSV